MPPELSVVVVPAVPVDVPVSLPLEEPVVLELEAVAPVPASLAVMSPLVGGIMGATLVLSVDESDAIGGILGTACSPSSPRTRSSPRSYMACS